MLLHLWSSLRAKQLPPVAGSYYKGLISIVMFTRCFQLNSRIFHATYHSLLRSWNVLNKEKKSPWTAKKSKRGPKKTTKAEFLEHKKKTLTDSGRGSCILVPALLPRLFLLVFPISHERQRGLYKCTLEFNKENVTVSFLLLWNSRKNHFACCER